MDDKKGSVNKALIRLTRENHEREKFLDQEDEATSEYLIDPVICNRIASIEERSI